MKNIRKIILIVVLSCGLMTSSGYAQADQKLAQTGFQFLSVISDARGAGMGEAMTSLESGSSSLFFNPAGMAGMKDRFDVTASVNQWIADIKHYTFSVVFNPGADIGVFGVSVQSVDYGEFLGTVVDKTSDLGFQDTGPFKLSALAAGIGYAKQLTDQFSIGGQVRLAHQDLGTSLIPATIQRDSVTIDTVESVSNTLNPLVFDFGTQFKTGIKSLVFGMSVRNFSKEVKYAQEGFQTPLVFTLGISMNLMDLLSRSPENQTLFMSIDATHYRDHPEQIKIGLEYNFMNVVKLRGGYVSKSDYDQSSFTYGLGVAFGGFGIDYAYTPFEVFTKVQRLTARITY
jgi:hypothetical protein